MALFAVGDVQGCYEELRALLTRISFRPDADRLWFAGDLVNRGPHSLQVLRFVKSLGDNAVTVLGNHDLHLLAAAAGVRRPHAGDTFADVLTAPDREPLIEWLQMRPLMHRDTELGFALLHAGLAPQWDIELAARCAAEIETALRSAQARDFLSAMYGDQPDLWSNELQGMERLRFSLNCFTRLRLCDREGRLHLRAKGAVRGRSDGLIPWFEVPGRASAGVRIVFGHWSALGVYQSADIYATDSGCVWGGSLSAVRLDVEPAQWYAAPCPVYCAVDVG